MYGKSNKGIVKNLEVGYKIIVSDF